MAWKEKSRGRALLVGTGFCWYSTVQQFPGRIESSAVADRKLYSLVLGTSIILPHCSVDNTTIQYSLPITDDNINFRSPKDPVRSVEVS